MEDNFYAKWLAKKRFIESQPYDAKKEAEEFVDKQQYYQQFLAAKRKTWMPIVAKSDWSWQSDTMFYPNLGKTRAIFCAIEMTRKVGFVRVYKGASPTAAQCVEFLTELRNMYPVSFLGADPGSEYKNNLVAAFCKKRGIDIFYYQTNDSRSKGIIERFNKTVRMMLNWYTFNKGKSWLTVLAELIDSDYNTKVHTATKLAPLEVTDEQSSRLRQEKMRTAQPYLTKLHKIEAGDRVRVYYKEDPDIPANQLEFRKLSNNWSKKVYVVEAKKGYRVKLVGINKLFSVSDLQPIVEEEGEEAPGGVSEVARKKKAKQAQELRQIDAVVPNRELTALVQPGRALRKNPRKKDLSDDFVA